MKHVNKFVIISILTIIILLVTCLLIQSREPGYQIVDEFLDTSGAYFGYDSVYYVIVEYDGEMYSEHMELCEKKVFLDYYETSKQVDILQIKFTDKYQGREYYLKVPNCIRIPPDMQISWDYE